jgi:hypothetical protein
MVQALDLVRKLQVMVACVTVPDDKQTNMSKRPHQRTFPILASCTVQPHALFVITHLRYFNVPPPSFPSHRKMQE